MFEKNGKLLEGEPELKWLNESKKLPCPQWVKWFKEQSGCSLREAVDAGSAKLSKIAAPQPPALGGEVEVYRHRLLAPAHHHDSGSRTTYRSEWVDVVLLAAHRAHVARLQAEVERLRQKHRDELGKRLAGEVKAEARTAELEGLLRDIKQSDPDRQCLSYPMHRRIDAALAEGAKS